MSYAYFQNVQRRPAQIQKRGMPTRIGILGGISASISSKVCSNPVNKKRLDAHCRACAGSRRQCCRTCALASAGASTRDRGRTCDSCIRHGRDVTEAKCGRHCGCEVVIANRSDYDLIAASSGRSVCACPGRAARLSHCSHDGNRASRRSCGRCVRGRRGRRGAVRLREDRIGRIAADACAGARAANRDKLCRDCGWAATFLRQRANLGTSWNGAGRAKSRRQCNGRAAEACCALRRSERTGSVLASERNRRGQAPWERHTRPR
jgi:hypothetical protein